MSTEFLLNSRTVFSALTTPLLFRTFHCSAPVLVLLWAMSPLGGQASLRVISTETLHDIRPKNYSYLSFFSPFIPSNARGTVAGPPQPINAVFSGALAGSRASKLASQDLYGNVKIPFLESLQNTDSGWRNVSEPSEDTWSSHVGIPIHGTPDQGISEAMIDTWYMIASCKLAGRENDANYTSLTGLIPGSEKGYPGWSGANYNFTMSGTYECDDCGTMYRPRRFDLFSVVSEWSGDYNLTKKLTHARCKIEMSYVQVEIECNGRQCGATKVRRLPEFWHLLHAQIQYKSNETETWVKAVALELQSGANGYSNFWSNLATATSPQDACATVHCGTSSIEAFLFSSLSPSDTGGYGNPVLWQVDEVSFSRRMTQLLNTYWIPSVAPYAITGNFSVEKTGCTGNPCRLMEGYNIDSSMGIVSVPYTTLKCNYEWLVVMFAASTLLLLLALGSLCLNVARRGPDLLDCFSTLLKDSKYVNIPDQNSLEDAATRSRALKDTVIRFGDVRPEADIGYAAYSVVDNTDRVTRLKPRRYYN